MAAFRPLPPAHEHSNSNSGDGGGGGDELMNVPVWAWWTFGLSLLLVLLFLLLDWLLIRRNALGSSPLCMSFRRHPSGKFGYSSAAGAGGGGADWQPGQSSYAGGSLALTSGQGAFGHHKRSTNLILAV